MATPGELIEATSRALGLPEAKVFSTHRYLREAGLVTKGGRGTSAARMTPKDASALLIAAICASEVKASSASFKLFGGMPVEGKRRWSGETCPALARLPSKHNFSEALAALLSEDAIEYLADDGGTHVLVRIQQPYLKAEIEVNTHGITGVGSYGHNLPSKRPWSGPTMKLPGDLTILSQFSEQTIYAVGNVLRGVWGADGSDA